MAKISTQIREESHWYTLQLSQVVQVAVLCSSCDLFLTYMSTKYSCFSDVDFQRGSQLDVDDLDSIGWIVNWIDNYSIDLRSGTEICLTK